MLNDDIDWEDKFPGDYEDLIQRSDKKLQYKTKKELYILLCEGILIDNGKLVIQLLFLIVLYFVYLGWYQTAHDFNIINNHFS